MNDSVFLPGFRRSCLNVKRSALSVRLWPGALACAFFFTVALSGAPAAPELAAKIDRLFAKWDSKETPGVIVAIARDGETIFSRAYGMANLEHGIPLTPETVTESGSVAKQFTAAAVVLLAQRGKLSLDDSIRKHLPELPSPLMDAITVRMLLNHTSGIRDIHGLFDLMGRPSYSSFHSNAEVLQVMTRQRDLNFTPGSEYLYSNGAYILAAVLVERVSRQSFGAFCNEQVFKPRGMTHTRWRDDFTVIVPGRATGYSLRTAGGYEIDLPYSNLVGNGGLLTTVGDLLKWNASFDDASGEWAEVVRALQTPSKLNDGRVIDYALGLTVSEEEGVQEISHGGATSGFKTFLARFPEKKVSFALLGNAGEFNPASVARALTRVLLDLPSREPKRIEVPASELAALAGTYHAKQTDDLVTFTVRDGKLMDDGAEIIPVAPGVFTSANGRTSFTFSGGSPRRLRVVTKHATADYEAVEKVKPSAVQLAAYAGTYYSAELDVAQVIGVKDGRLTASRWPGAPLVATPTFTDGFLFGRSWHATFTRDAGGGISGLELTNGRCRRVKFERR